MATIEALDIADLVTTTLAEKGRLRFTNIATTLQTHEVMSRLLKKDKVLFESGTSIERQVMVSHSGAAEMAGLHAVDNANITDNMATMTVPWRHTKTHWAIERREILMNRSPAKINDLLSTRRIASLISLAELLETEAFSKPATSADELHVFGFLYWLAYNATAGFNGGAVTGFTGGPGGLSPTTYARHKNYTAQYTNVERGDLIRKMKNAIKQTGWTPPIDINDYRTGNGQRFRIYMSDTTLTAIEELAENQNDNLGRDVDSMDGKSTFKGFAMQWIPWISTNLGTSLPVFMIDFNDVKVAVLSGDYLHETVVKPAPNQHNDTVVWLDLTWQILFHERRRHALIAKSDPVTDIA